MASQRRIVSSVTPASTAMVFWLAKGSWSESMAYSAIRSIKGHAWRYPLRRAALRHLLAATATSRRRWLWVCLGRRVGLVGRDIGCSILSPDRPLQEALSLVIGARMSLRPPQQVLPSTRTVAPWGAIFTVTAAPFWERSLL